MNQVLLTLTLSHFHLILTGWKLIGLAGALCFTARWFVQAAYRMKTGSNAVPSSFWWISLIGASTTLCYFVFGKNDSVGIIQNLFPTVIAVYNLWLDRAHARRTTAA
jgi:lipid-A-disaccharide synthase-like uncharacterized protein